jgi:hypothetical protein
LSSFPPALILLASALLAVIARPNARTIILAGRAIADLVGDLVAA